MFRVLYPLWVTLVGRAPCVPVFEWNKTVIDVCLAIS